MRKILSGVLGLLCIAASGAAFAYSEYGASNPGNPFDVNELHMAGFNRNTLVVYIPGLSEKHTWYMVTGSAKLFDFGTAQHFDAEIMPNGNISMKVHAEKWRQDTSDFPRVVSVNADGSDGLALQLRNHFPGDHWRELVPGGPHQDMREQYTIIPGHQ